MIQLFITIIIICLLVLFIQDLKYREIHVLVPVLIFLSAYGILYVKTNSFSIDPLFNIGFFVMTFGVMVAYMSLKNKSFLNPFMHYFGLGDVLYFIAIAPLFMLHNYIVFFIMSMLFSIIAQQLFKNKMKQETIPLAGFSGLLLIIALATDLLFNFHDFTLIG